MIRVGTIYQNEVTDAVIQNVTCPHCQSQVNAMLNRSVQTGTILFIPFIKKTVQYYSVCPHCNMKYILNKNDYNQIIRSPYRQSEWIKTCKNILEKTIVKSRNAIVRSSKSVLFASVLSLLGGFLGLQNLYMGHKKRFLINILLFMFSIITINVILTTSATALVVMSAIPLATNVYWGIIDFIRILSGHAKDSDGAYLLTTFQYKKRLNKLNELTSIRTIP